MNEEERKAYEKTLKFRKEEEVLDRFLYRPIGFRLALAFKKINFTPNNITILSIFVGMGGAICFGFEDFWINFVGCCLFIMANFLDCADGQLARLTSQTSRIGRILDGMAGDIWFLLMYVCLALRGMFCYDWDAWIYIPIVLSALSHSKQASMSDFYKNVHLYFIKRTHGGEVDDLNEVMKEYEQYSWATSPIKKLLLNLYISYTKEQANISPEFNEYRRIVKEHFENVPPEDLVEEWCVKNRNNLYYVHLLSFSFRTLFLFIFVLSGYWYLYLAFEIGILNIILVLLVKNYKRALQEINQKLLLRIQS